MKVEINRLDHQGRGIGVIAGKTTFIPDALPGEVVEVVIKSNKKKYMIGEVLKILKSSDMRIKPVCPYFNRCGGCDLMHLSYRDQMIYKEDKVKDILRKFVGISSDVVKPIIGCDESLHYRNKVTFQVDHKIGFYEKKSREIVSVDCCMIAQPKINHILAKLKMLPMSHINQIVIRTDTQLDETMVVIKTTGKIKDQLFVKALKEDVTSIVKLDQAKLTVLHGLKQIKMKLGDYTFWLSPTSFFQVNSKQCEQLYEQVWQYANITQQDIVLDLYCGTGTIGIYLSKFAKHVYGIEINQAAIACANENKKLNAISNITFQAGDVGRVIKQLKIQPDVVIVDPPRAGLDVATKGQLLKCQPRTIVYVSCDPVTLARDLKELSLRYNIQAITPVDMFPQTYHVECVCVLERR